MQRINHNFISYLLEKRHPQSRCFYPPKEPGLSPPLLPSLSLRSKR